ncbi:MAG: hypothetical protein ABI175_13115 [Polyangiales bacterium]
MIRAPAALALVVLASASRVAGAEPCAAQAQLTGDREAVARVGAELVKLGVALGAGTQRCPAVQATVELAREDGAIDVAVRGSGQRSEGRVVTDPSVAAAWIDAWVRDDLDVAGWAPEVAAAPPLPAAPGTVAPRDVAVEPPAPSVLEALGVTALYEQAWTDDGTSWRGGSVGICVRVHGVCIGGRVRGMTQPDRTSNLSAAARSDLSVLATASLPIAAGQMIIAPELGVGVGRFSTRRVEGCTQPEDPGGTMMPPNCDPTDPMCVMPEPSPTCAPDASGTDPSTGSKLYVGDKFDTATYTPRLSVALRISIPLFRHLWLDGVAAYSLMPLGHGDAFTPAKAPAGLTEKDIALPGEPGGGLVVGVGLRLGAP